MLALEPKARGAVREQVHGARISLEIAVIDIISFYQPRHVKSGTLKNRVSGLTFLHHWWNVRPDTLFARDHTEIDTVIGRGSKDCIVTIVEHKSGYVLIGKLKDRTTRSLNQRCIKLLHREPAKFKTITADNGAEFHQYPEIEKATNTEFYFANPHHSWERGTNENTNGLIRQYIP